MGKVSLYNHILHSPAFCMMRQRKQSHKHDTVTSLGLVVPCVDRYFGKEDVAATALDAILAFMPNVPNWAYNGAALGIGDFSNNAKLTPYGGWERVLQHYRAGATAAHPIAHQLPF